MGLQCGQQLRNVLTPRAAAHDHSPRALFDGSQVSIPTWALVHLPVAVTLSTAWFTRKVPWVGACPAVWRAADTAGVLPS